MKMLTVNDMYNFTKQKNVPLLSNFSGLFWKEYIDNFDKYDKVFNRMYRSFIYFIQPLDVDIEELTELFIDDVSTHLLINSKKYSELYRAYMLNEEDYLLLENYNITESMSRNISNTGNTTRNGYNDTISETLGSHTDNNNESIGERVDSKSDNIGSVSTTTTSTTGAQTNSQTNKVTAFDVDDFKNESGVDTVNGERIDSGNNTVSEQNNTYSNTIGNQKNSSSTTFGEQNNTSTHVVGDRIDNHSEEETESYTLNRKGNIGVQTATDMLVKHNRFWNEYEFYTKIFEDICRELLNLVD